MPSPKKTWTIVCFLADDSVEAVPTRWINGDDCLWPAVTREKLHILIKKCEFNSCWPSHKVKPFRNATYDDYAIARKKAAKAEMTSDLNTDEGETVGIRTSSAKRFRKKKVFSSSDSENSDCDNEILAKKKKIPAPPTWTDNFTDKAADVDKENDLQENIQLIENYQCQSSATFGARSSVTPVARAGPNKQIKSMASSTSSETRSGCCCNPQVLYNIQALLVEINTKVSKYKCTNEDKDETNILEKSNLDFPIKTKQDLIQFEQFLSVTENYSGLVRLFTQMGGSNSYEFIRRCVAPLISNVLAEQFSFLGKKEKDTFRTTALAKAIIDAAHKSGISKTQKETELKIGDWLRRAKERRIREEQK